MSDADSILESVAEQFIESLRAGEAPSIDAYARQHPSLSDEIHEILSSIEMMEQLSHCESDSREKANHRMSSLPIDSLGDFNIVREIGRGGMGVVYEAVDRTLQRQVALKVLNDSALTSQKHINRFRRESRLAAQLHHTNIVPVFGVGEEQRKHFYAMQYVEGVSIHDIIEGLKNLPGSVERPSGIDSGEWNAGDGLDVAAAFRGGEFAEPRNTPSNVRPTSSPSNADPIQSNASGLGSRPGSHFENTIDLSDAEASRGSDSGFVNELDGNSEPSEEVRPSLGSDFGNEYWRSVARVGLQVSDALHYAHVQGILHRDIKPANLLFDSNGTVWVADFGLAKLSETDDLTQTGDVVGTLKYMAPEQLAGKADARTDVYALGLTLYELLTLRPVHDGETYKDLFSQKQNANHPAPRSLVPSVPRDLETIVQKALELESDKRYSSAREIHEDLQRFLDDRPIMARQITLSERAWRWCRRNKVLATMGAMLTGAFLALLTILSWAYLREAEHAVGLAAERDKSEQTMNVVLDGFDDLFLSYLESDEATVSTLSSAGADSADLAPAMLSKDTAEVMEKMLLVYDRLAEQDLPSSNGSLAVESAKARRRVGDLYRKLGRFEKANEAYEDAATRYERLRQEDDSTHQLEVARIHQAMGKMHEQREEIELAKTEYAKALAALSDMEESDEAMFELARTHYLLAKRVRPEGGARPGRGPSRGPGRGQGLGGRPGFGVPRTAPPPGRPERVDPIDNASDGASHSSTAIELLTDLRSRHPNHAEYRFLLALCVREQDADTTIELLDQLVDQFPTVQRYRFELCETYRAYNERTVGVELQLKNLQRARKFAEQLVEEQRDAAAYRINLAHIYAFLGVAYAKQSNICEAEKYTRLAMETHASVVSDFPGLATLSGRLTKNDRMRLADWLMRLRRNEELVELLEPFGNQLFEEAERAREKEEAPSPGVLATLDKCRSMLLPVYEELGDDVGYFVALSWAESGDSVGRGPNGPPPGFRGAGGPGGPVGDRGAPRPDSAVDMAMSYDLNGDARITRDEVPQRMASEWFSRIDSNGDGEVDRDELRRAL